MGRGRAAHRPQGSLEIVPARYLIDTSALARQRHPSVDERITPLLIRGDLATCGVVELEMLYSARGAPELEASRDHLRTLGMVAMRQEDLERASEVMGLLASRGKHRSAGAADVLIAACAERAGLTLLHYDSDFEHVGEVTGQPMEWVVPRGSIP